jgi:hypothetical protein
MIELPTSASGSALRSVSFGAESIATAVRHHARHTPIEPRSSHGSFATTPKHFVHIQPEPCWVRQLPQPKLPQRLHVPIAFTSECTAQSASPTEAGSGNVQCAHANDAGGL